MTTNQNSAEAEQPASADCVSGLVVLKDEPQDAGEYLWRAKPTDPWRKVRQCWRDDMLHEGWSYKIVQFQDSGEVVDARKLTDGEWAIQHNAKHTHPQTDED